jgi:hypothetical protein
MHSRMMTAVGALALTFAVSACNREATVAEPRGLPVTDAPRTVDRATELQQQRLQDLSKMDARVASIERNYEEMRKPQAQGTSGGTATSGLRADVKSDMADLKKAVDHLRTTTAENWWDRHQAALKTAVDEVERDVERFSGIRVRHLPPKNTRVADEAGQPVSTAPFTSTRDKFVGDMHTRVDAMDKVLDDVKATGRRKTQLDDLHARVNKLGDDIDRLKSASAEDWWDLSKARVNDYIERVKKSVTRLDDNK